MIGNLYDTVCDIAYSMALVDYEVYVFAKNGNVVMYGKPKEIYCVIGSYFKSINVNDYEINEDVHRIYLCTDL